MEFSFYHKLYPAVLQFLDLCSSLFAGIHSCACKVEEHKVVWVNKELIFFQITITFCTLQLNIWMITEISKRNSQSCTLKNFQEMELQFPKCMRCSWVKKYILIIQLCPGLTIKQNYTLAGKDWHLVVPYQRACWYQMEWEHFLQ